MNDRLAGLLYATLLSQVYGMLSFGCHPKGFMMDLSAVGWIVFADGACGFASKEGEEITRMSYFYWSWTARARYYVDEVSRLTVSFARSHMDVQSTSNVPTARTA